MSSNKLEQNKYLIGISVYQKIGPIRYSRLIKYFKDEKLIWTSSYDELVNAGLEKNISKDFVIKREQIDLDKEINKLKKEKISIVKIGDTEYPKQLEKIESPPFLIYYKGEIKHNYTKSVAIVGTRKLSHYGKQSTHEITKNLTSNKIITISGLALGIDTIVHKTTVENNGKTIAVLGSGLNDNNIYPKTNFLLSKKIVESGGCVMTEFPAGAQPMPYNFPLRNRIVSGLCSGLLVIESPEKGGSLITASHAKDQGKKIFAVPGSIYSKNSSGTNNLIKNNEATMITNANDLLKGLNVKTNKHSNDKKEQTSKLSDNEKIILKLLDRTPMHIDKLVRISGLSSNTISSVVTMLEINGMIKNIGNMNYAKIY